MFQFLSLLPHADQFALLRLFKYLSFRGGGAVLTALFVAFVIGPRLIAWLKVRQGKGQPIRTDGPQRHIVEKQGTPTMGGLLILLPTVVSTLFWADLANQYVWVVLLVTVSYGLLGFVDDYLKVTKRSSGGVSGWVRLGVEFGVAFIATWWMMRLESPELSGMLAVPFLKLALIPFGMSRIMLSVEFLPMPAGTASRPSLWRSFQATTWSAQDVSPLTPSPPSSLPEASLPEPE